jgi:glycosyltransferase involved in cell wall biosynthesis
VTDSALIFNPALHVLGGAEQYNFDVGAFLRARGYDVVIAAPRLPTIGQIQERGWTTDFHLAPLSVGKLTEFSREFDVLVNTASSPPRPSLAKRSFLVVQFPVTPVSGWRRAPGAAGHVWSPLRLRWRQRRNLAGYKCVVYSEFVAGWMRRRWHVESSILPPAVRLGHYEPDQKEHVILGVGRFYPEFHRKRHDVLIDAFRQIPREIRTDWRLVLLGGVDRTAPGADAFMEDLRERADGLPVTFLENADVDVLVDVSRRASLFWHAAGYGRDPDKPEQTEHFGISVIEAMSYGSVPLVYADGGPLETVAEDAGEHWKTVDDLVQRTTALMATPADRGAKAQRAFDDAKAFGLDRFNERADRVFFGRGGRS